MLNGIANYAGWYEPLARKQERQLTHKQRMDKKRRDAALRLGLPRQKIFWEDGQLMMFNSKGQKVPVPLQETSNQLN